MLSVHTCPLAQLGGWETGGMNVYVRELSRALARRGVQVDVFTRRQHPHTPRVVEFAPGARVVHLEAGPSRHLDKYEALEYLSEFACNMQRFRALEGVSYDVLHSHYWLSGRLAAIFKERWSAPLVAMFHTLARAKTRAPLAEAEREDHVREEIELRTMAIADRVIATTPADRDHMTRYYGAARSSISVIPCGVDTTLFRPRQRAAARRRLGLGSERVLVFVGRIQQLKGIDLLLRSAAELARDGKPLRVLVVGGIPRFADGRVSPEQQEMQRLLTLRDELGLGERVHFVGAVDQADLPTYYSAADVTVVPSWYESFGLVALESMACGTPVVAARVGGLASLVRDGETGHLVAWRDPALYAERIREVCEPATRRRMGRAARALAQEYSWPAVAEHVLDVYQTLRERSAPATARR
jgi:D-inositol-3-phosphate glycosyltransferase